MASIKNTSSSLLLLLLFSLFTTTPTPTAAISTSSLDSLLYLLRTRGHSLFANAITTSDLLFDLLYLQSLTLLAPPNPSLFALDMTLTPPYYISTLRLHVTPSLLSFPIAADIAAENSSFSTVHTLLRSRDLHFTTDLTGSPCLDGVEVILPALYLSSNVAVYRLRDMLPSRDFFIPPPSLPPASAPAVLSPPPSPNTPTVSPTPDPENYPVLAPNGYSPAESRIEILSTIRDYGGIFATERINEEAEKCGAFDEETKPCWLKDEHTGLGHVREGNDYTVRDYMMDYTH